MSNVSTVKIATIPNGWLSLPCAMENMNPRPLCPMPGLNVELLLAALNVLSLPYELIPAKLVIGYYEDGRWKDGLFEGLQNGTYDTLAIFLVDTAQRRMNFSFSYPVYDVNLIFLTAGPENNFIDNAGLLYKVYGTYIWIVLLLCCSTNIMLSVLVRILDNPKFHNQLLRCKNILKTSISICAMVFLNLYGCLLLTHLLSLTQSYKIKDVWHMIELIEKKEIQLIVDRRASVIDETIGHSQHPFYKELRKSLVVNPPIYNTDMGPLNPIGPLVSTGHYVAAGYSFQIASYKQHECSIRIIGDKEYLPTYSQQLIFRKGYPLLPAFDQALIALQDHAQKVYIRYQHWLDSEAKCSTAKHAGSYKPLGIISLYGAFVTLLSAAGLCCLSLVAELIFKKWKITKNRVRTYPEIPSDESPPNRKSFDINWVLQAVLEKTCMEFKANASESIEKISLESILLENLCDVWRFIKGEEMRQVDEMMLNVANESRCNESKARQKALGKCADLTEYMIQKNKDAIWGIIEDKKD